MERFHVLIVAAGRGERMGGLRPKQYELLGGMPVLRRCLKTFLSCPGIENVTVVIDPSHEDLYREAVQGLDLPAPVFGGPDRQSSVYNGLKSLLNLKDADRVLIHDAARPFVTQADILSVVRALETSKAATLSYPVPDTLVRENGTSVDRTGVHVLQTPQGFHYGLIRQAHEKAGENHYTDDTALVRALGENVALIPGSRNNFKITTPEDRILAENLVRPDMETFTGTGFDVHAFDTSRTVDTVRLCGIDVPYPHPLSGHSDADVGLHALTDAILGAIGGGDIGQLFPPSDPRWKNTDSALFLEKALSMLKEKNGVIGNIDLTLICETPKIGPHREAMAARIAQICAISPARVNVKATTTEGLGFTGRGEGIAAQAVATIRVPIHDKN